MSHFNSICVYCGSRMGDQPIFEDAAHRLGREILKEKLTMVYGGGSLGLMGATAGTVRDGGGDVFGVIPEFLLSMEGKLEGVEHTIVQDMHERKMLMYEKSDVICTLPGGIGTLEEIIEVMSWGTLQLHTKPMILLNLEGFWSPLIELVDHIIDRGFASKSVRENLIIVETPEEVIPAAKKALGIS